MRGAPHPAKMGCENLAKVIYDKSSRWLKDPKSEIKDPKVRSKQIQAERAAAREAKHAPGSNNALNWTMVIIY